MPKIDEDSKVVPFWQTTDESTVRLYLGHVTDILKGLPEKSVHMCVTSPPYWGLRSYATGDVKHLEIGAEPSPDCGTQGQAQCGRCFVCTMVDVFREVRRVLRDDGTLWLNLGDTYSGGKTERDDSGDNGRFADPRIKPTQRKPTQGLPPGNLVGIPWRVGLALQADGWVLRQDIIWHKPAPMPESVRNRCTKAHEYVFLFAKGSGYYCDMEAIKERSSEASVSRMAAGYNLKARRIEEAPPDVNHLNPNPDVTNASCKRLVESGLANKRSVWTVSAQGYAGAHFATFPPKLIEPMIKAGTSEKGCCANCGTPWTRIVEETKLTRERPNDYVKRTGEEGTGNSCANTVAGVEVKTVGWRPGCDCQDTDEGMIQAIELGAETVVPCTVLDPFIGSGTTCAVSVQLGRASIGIDLSEQYLRKNAIPRVQGVMLGSSKRDLVPKKAIKQLIRGRVIGK